MQARVDLKVQNAFLKEQGMSQVYPPRPGNLQKGREVKANSVSNVGDWVSWGTPRQIRNTEKGYLNLLLFTQGRGQFTETSIIFKARVPIFKAEATWVHCLLGNSKHYCGNVGYGRCSWKYRGCIGDFIWTFLFPLWNKEARLSAECVPADCKAIWESGKTRRGTAERGLIRCS